MNDQATRTLVFEMTMALENALRSVLPPGFTPEMVVERCTLETRGRDEVVMLAGVPVLRIGPPRFTHERTGFAWVLKVERDITKYVLSTGP